MGLWLKTRTSTNPWQLEQLLQLGEIAVPTESRRT